MTHDASKQSNVGVVVSYLKQWKKGYSFVYLKKEETSQIKSKKMWKSFFSFFIEKSYHLATAEYVLQDNIFLPMAYLHFKKEVAVIQLWHGTGTIKKFGQSVNTAELGKLEKRANQTITHLIVNSKLVQQQYKEAFGIGEEKIYIWGMPRTDFFFQEEKKKERLKQFYQRYPFLKEKRILLYAPTFRDKEVDNPTISLSELVKELKKDEVIVLKLHPFISNIWKKRGKYKKSKQIIDLSDCNVNDILLAADVLITDYSSIIFEYCLLEKPMIFYAYDYQEFLENGRGFYKPYKEYVPGPVCYTQEELIKIIRMNQYDIESIKNFKESQYCYLDGKSTKRLVDGVFRKT